MGLHHHLYDVYLHIKAQNYPIRETLERKETWTTLAISLAVIYVVWLIFRLVRGDPEAGVTFHVPSPEQTAPGWRGKTLHPPSIKVSGSTAIQCYAPATGSLLGLINPSTPAGIDRAIQKASDAQRKWALTTFAQRRHVLKTLLKFIFENQDTIVRAACLDSGKTRVDALFGEVLVTAEKLKWTIDHGEKALTPERRPTNLLMFYKHNEVRYEPLGVVSACVSWNYPFHNFMGPVISALFSGNASVVKVSEQTAWSSMYFADIARAALKACGHDENLVHAIACWPQTAPHFTSHPGIGHLTFIGSKPVAHEVARSAAESLTPLCVELGGKDAALILDDLHGDPMRDDELKRVSSIIMRGVFQSAGQNCIGIERVIAMPNIYTRLVEALEPRVKAMRAGSDLDSKPGKEVDMGAMVSAASFERLESLIAEAVSQGARLLAGGRRLPHDEYPDGSYFQPTLLVDVTSEMRIANEELFAPVCVLMRAKTVDEAIAITNGTLYGLGCSVFGPTSHDAGRSRIQRIVREVKSGMVAINDFAVYYAVQLPFGGIKGSGYGRFAGEEGLRGLCNVKSVCSDRWSETIRTTIPAKLDYPMQNGAWEMGKGVIEVGYGETWSRRATGLRKVIGI